MSSQLRVRSVSPSEAVVARIANCEGVDPLELPPLYESIDADAIDALVRTAEANDSALQIEFTYHGYQVTISDGGVVHVDEKNAVE